MLPLEKWGWRVATSSLVCELIDNNILAYCLVNNYILTSLLVKITTVEVYTSNNSLFFHN